ncbi:hypothetical protein [Paenibacillus thiaminolyticus]|uniref:Uncharacterized protein n=1 Tax=Paenibacillus thiaminolyticus TaxID=49283 RepID=A0A3A3G8L4_PANTH|nr:hypothetical protein [Paenibacillus thiaminolyticus]RJG15633.1 hypothetical protein DQX05_29570 [Paenibacillus thiaminolyticus]
MHRSATFLLKYCAADAKLVELVQAIDKGQFATAARLADEAKQLLQSASLARRRAVKVTTIVDLTGTRARRICRTASSGFSSWPDVVHFRIARDHATRLRCYQQWFLLPMLRAMIRSELGAIPGAIDILSTVTGFYVGVGMLGTPPGMVKPPHTSQAKRVVAGRLRWNDPLGDLPYTSRLMYDDDRRLDGPFPLTPQVRNFFDVTKPDPSILHPLEERYAGWCKPTPCLPGPDALSHRRPSEPGAGPRALQGGRVPARQGLGDHGLPAARHRDPPAWLVREPAPT